ncbi:hypothetical protein DAPPUDRAFT_313930 [Daphnia pulex]|uniref:Uncharacterized protein n=1 Tax=Daphnia pulex TaxID=6669 RepID=E9G5Q1_DAPPU|nr:hypothetical protein DAPPUDRAFT_313930 [Daphnia pulex]|eukprot:EFX85247.1 hypothetical protein DAPPUDRAFT_313930 [Daphnia pulex]
MDRDVSNFDIVINRRATVWRIWRLWGNQGYGGYNQGYGGYNQGYGGYNQGYGGGYGGGSRERY